VGERIWLSPPHMSGEEQALVNDAFRSNWIAPLGPHVDAFERELATVTRTRHAAALSSGTAAIHLALHVLGVQPGDWVLCQSFTFAGTVNPVRYVGAVPVLVGSEPSTWNMDPEALRDAILAARSRQVRPSAIIPVHLYGMPAQMNELLAVAREFEIPVIEDAAEALGSTLGARPCGGFGDLSILSFNGNKIITTSGGGALLSDREDWIARARFLATQARDPAPHYEHTEIGYNYRLSNVLAAIGRGQLGALEERVAARRANFERYRSFFASYPTVRLLEEPTPDYASNRWLTTILVDADGSNSVTADNLRVALSAADIEARPLWKPMHLQPVFRDAPYFGNDLAERLFTTGLCLPSGSSLGASEFERIFDVLADALG
jgi:dTDP-4-amino-4,6-dideoxygalactose transaminase